MFFPSISVTWMMKMLSLRVNKQTFKGVRLAKIR